MKYERFNTPDKRHLIDREMTEIASDPIGAFQQISNVMVAMNEKIEELERRVSVLEGDSTVTST